MANGRQKILRPAEETITNPDQQSCGITSHEATKRRAQGIHRRRRSARQRTSAATAYTASACAAPAGNAVRHNEPQADA